MEASKLHRGRLIDHLQLVVADFDVSKQFYSALMESLGIPAGMAGADFFSYDELFVSSTESRTGQGVVTGRVHLAFVAKDRGMVERAHAAALGAGGKDNGAPGERPYHPGYYAAFVLDPDGNNIEIVFHGPAKQTAESIEITW